MSRLRTRGTPPHNEYVMLQKNSVTYQSINTTVHERSEVMTDVVTANVHAKLRRGEIVNNPCAYTLSEQDAGGGFFSTTNGVDTYSTTGAGSVTQAFLSYGTPSGVSHPTVDEESVVDTAKQLCLANIDRAPYSIAEDIAEMRETVSFLRDPLRGLRRSHDSLFLRRRHPITNVALSRSASIAELWADYHWALTPFVNSLTTVYNGLTLPKTARAHVQVARGRSTDTGRVVQPDLRHYFAPGRYDQFHHGEDLDFSARAYILYRLYNPAEDWRSRYGLRLKDIPETLWAISPYSFMVDRVSNISASLRGIGALTDPNIKFEAAGVVTKRDHTEVWRYITQNDYPYVCTASGDNYVSRQFTYQRTLWNPSILDTFVTSDFHKLVKDTKSIVDLAALIRLAV